MECPQVKNRLLGGCWLLLVITFSLLLLECRSLSPTQRSSRDGGTFPTSGVSRERGRKGKQFFLPLVSWPYQQQYYYHYQPQPMGYFIVPQSQSHPGQSQGQQYQYQYVQQPYYHVPHQQQYTYQQPISIRTDQEHNDPHQNNQIPSSSTPLPMDTMMYNHRRDVPPVTTVHSSVSILSRQVEERVATMGEGHSHANHGASSSSLSSASLPKAGMPCKTSNGRMGTCQKFSDCFPMIEMEYGGSAENDHHEDMGSLPLVEQLMQNTNASACSQGSEYVHMRVCCPRTDADAIRRATIHRVERLQKNGVGSHYEDRQVALPSVTQRPPMIKAVVSRQLIDKQMCGSAKALRSPGPKNGKKHSGGEGGGVATPKVTGGVEATGPKEFPWMVAVFGKNRKIFCGASLITDRFLLSAAHCFSTFAPSDIQSLYVHLGDFNLRTTFDGPHEVRKIEKIIIHKGFKIKTYKDDIALLKLDRPVNFTDRIQPICLPEPTNDLHEKRQVVVTGWGRKFRYGVTSDTLRKVEMPVWNHAECKRVFETFAPGRLLDTNICAGDGKKNKDACSGDSGGPALLHDGSKWVQLGITSWGKGCGNFPGVYTRVDKYLMWITKNLEQYQN